MVEKSRNRTSLGAFYLCIDWKRNEKLTRLFALQTRHRHRGIWKKVHCDFAWNTIKENRRGKREKNACSKGREQNLGDREEISMCWNPSSIPKKNVNCWVPCHVIRGQVTVHTPSICPLPGTVVLSVFLITNYLFIFFSPLFQYFLVNSLWISLSPVITIQ